MLYVLRTGATWRDLPAHFGSWSLVYPRFRRWCGSGCLDRCSRSSLGARRARCGISTVRASNSTNTARILVADRPRRRSVAPKAESIRSWPRLWTRVAGPSRWGWPQANATISMRSNRSCGICAGTAPSRTRLRRRHLSHHALSLAHPHLYSAQTHASPTDRFPPGLLSEPP